MGLFGGKERESREEPKLFRLEWVTNEGPNHIARLSVNSEHPLSYKSDDLFKEMIIPGLKEIIKGGNTILSIAPTYIDEGSGDVLDYVIVTQPSPSIR